MSFLGLDVGGTKCRFEWWPRGCAAGGDAPTARLALGDPEASVQLLCDLIARAVGAGRPPEALVCAVAGCGERAVAEGLAQALRPRVGAPVAVVGDVMAAAAAGLRDGPGLLLWSGTGSFAIARDDAGELVRVGGRGYAFGDEGSGYDLVRRSIIGVLRAVDGRGRETSLTSSLTEAFGASAPQRLGAVAQRLAPGEVAARLPVVLDAFEAGDWLAADVLMVGLRQLVEAGEVALRRVGLKPADGMRVAVGGGVMRSDVLREGLERLAQAAFEVEVEVLPVGVHDAAAGAAWLAAGWHAGAQPQQRWVANVAL